jgi:excisionase family DNA binding protein
MSEPLFMPVPEELVARITRHVLGEVRAELLSVDPLMTVEEAAEYLRCKTHRIYDLVRHQSVVPVRDGRRVLFRRSVLDAYLEGR